MSRPLPRLRTSLVFAMASLCACAADTRRAETPRGLALSVAPLSLTGVANACYRVKVENQLGDLVAEVTGVCADRYGDGAGGLTWIGPCDASTTGLPEGDTVNDNRVTLALEDLFGGDGTALIPRADYVNPCGVPGGNDDGFGPCVQTVACRENQDTPVRFDLTILRRANQGFFDIAVDFDDVFCSAKLDCIGDPPGLVFDPVSGERIASFVLGFACTSGSKGGAPEPTWMYLTSPVLTCNGLAPMTLPLDAVTRDGNQPGVGAVARWMHMTGKESLAQYDKCYWNIAGGLDMVALAGRTCTLTATGTASSKKWDDNTPPAGEVHPVITWTVPVLTGGALCENHGLDDGGGVRTGYVGQAIGNTGAAFTMRRACGPEVVEPPAPGFACGGADSRLLPATLDGDVAGVEVRSGGLTASFPLPAGGWALEGCCQSSCCQVP